MISKGSRELVPKGDAALLAAALLMALAVYSFLQTLVDGLIGPAIAAVLGEPSIHLLSFTINGSEFSYGSVLAGLILLVLAFAVLAVPGRIRWRPASRSSET